MKRVLIAVALLLLGSSALFAQDRSFATAGSLNGSTQNQPSRTVIVLPPIFADSCPVEMQARHEVWDHTVTVHQGAESYKGPFGQRISLTLQDSHSAKTIVAATVLVRGFNGKNQVIETGSNPEGNATKTLRTGFTRQADNTVSADLYITGFTAVSSVKLVDVTYSDGSTWHSDRSNPCRVAADPLMLVTAR